MSIQDDLRWYNKARRVLDSGNILYCRFYGDDREYDISRLDDIRVAGIAAKSHPDLEVLTIRGWRSPSECWVGKVRG